MVGMFRFLQRVWRNIVDERDGPHHASPTLRPTRRPAASCTRTIDTVRTEMDALRFNTAIAKLIELNNHAHQARRDPAGGRRGARADAVSAGAPRRRGAVAQARPRPTRSPTRRCPSPIQSLLLDDTVEYPVQVNGKVRSHITVAADADGDARRSRRPGRRQGGRRRSARRLRRRSSSSPAAWSTSSCSPPRSGRESSQPLVWAGIFPSPATDPAQI